MNEALHAQLYGTAVRLTRRPVSVPALLRTRWRVPVVVLIVAACRQQRAKREQIVVLNWALRDAETRNALVSQLSPHQTSRPVWVRYEPALVRATNIAHGLGLLRQVDEWLEITEAGEMLIESVDRQGLYAQERELLGELPRPLPLSVAQRILSGMTE